MNVHIHKIIRNLVRDKKLSQNIALCRVKIHAYANHKMTKNLGSDKTQFGHSLVRGFDYKASY